MGEITHLSGRVLDSSGSPIKNVTIEIWQCDANQVYLHTADSGAKDDQRDKNFQGFGRFTTGSKGEYYFRTIKPVPYPGRPAPHIHFKLKKGDRELLTTQINIAGHPGNDVDHVVRRRARRVRQGTADGRLQADKGLEDRRADRQFRYHPGPHSGRTSKKARRRDFPILIADPGISTQHP